MTNEAVTSPVTDDEMLARFVLFKRWFRAKDQTVKQDAFIPHPYPDLSVTRHDDLSSNKLWEMGQSIADARPATLYGRADITAKNVRHTKLKVEPKPEDGNPNHANIVGWPTEKPAQKSFAQELAAKAKFMLKP